MKNITIFHLKIIIFTVVKYYIIFYGRVFAMGFYPVYVMSVCTMHLMCSHLGKRQNTDFEDDQTDLNLGAHMSRVMRKPTFWFLTWSDTNRAAQPQKMARDLKFRI